MSILDIAAGLLFGALAGMGIGGGGLIVIYLTLFRDYSQRDAQGANLIFFIVAAAASLLIHFRKRKIKFFPVIFLTLGGLFGSFAGAHVTTLIPQEITRKLFGIMLVATGLITFIKTKRVMRKSPAIKGTKNF
ncbi:MAG: sulfite exporter TauE/SafE family protein [Ruminococcaceae bacterium]|nr:sulfite exporter TauE/SafE family protein [Oscillospiraceae bacterium]